MKTKFTIEIKIHNIQLCIKEIEENLVTERLLINKLFSQIKILEWVLDSDNELKDE